ncbi:MAG TPA: restriction endonuclease subunit S [Lentisphaeria bacterium]|nr:MAG: hypothetical protein A2X47_03980 [Lentisphaerae bacterium GWF2_38_69]HBM16147.1 restriction endonuclease subunit S [Lentisphaeria bacterium]
MNIREVKLNEIVNIYSGQGAPKEFSEYGRPFIRAGSLEKLQNGDSEFTCELLNNELAEKYKMSLYPKNSIVFPKSGMSAKIGRIYKLKNDCYVVNHLAVVVSNNKNKVDPSYLGKWFYYNPPSRLIANDSYPSIKLSQLNNIQILLPTLPEQKQIVEILDRADSLRQKRRESIKLLDEFLRSTFLEMFGEFEKKKWPQLKMIDLAKRKKGSMRTGPFGSSLLHSEFVKEGIAVLGIDNAVENYFTWKERRFITPEKYEKLKQYTVYPEDIIITIMGTLGRSAVVPDNIPTAINTKHLACITIDKKIANPYFVVYSIQSDPDVVHQLNNKRRGAIMDGLNLTIIKHLKFNLPPLALQETFVGIMKQTEALKKKLETSQIELDNQFNALMQRYFG